MNAFKQLRNKLKEEKSTWLITGVAGFIGSNLLESLINLNQNVIGLDNFSTGYQKNLDEALESTAGSQAIGSFEFIEGDVRSFEDCSRACKGVDYVLHHAALGSVPRSIDTPITSNQNNIDGFLNMLVAARDANVKRMVYASSSSVYGDHPTLPKVEDKTGKLLSPYAVTKVVNELYAEVFAKSYDFNTIGLRYFNVFGKRQDSKGAYAAVIPKWVSAMLTGDDIFINGDGETSRDFCYIDNAVQANLLSATTSSSTATNQVFNVAVGEQTSLNQLYSQIREELESIQTLPEISVSYRDFRPGDVRHSVADITKARKLLGYSPSHRVGDGLHHAMQWYSKQDKLQPKDSDR